MDPDIPEESEDASRLNVNPADVENRPPVEVISASSNNGDANNHHHIQDLDVEMSMNMNMESNDIISQRLAPSSGFVPGPLREEPTLKEKLVDRERQRRKEAERARLKRQFALMSNGGGQAFDSAVTGPGGGASVAGTMGEESTHADMEESISGLMHAHSHGDTRNQGGDNSPQLGYTMERFLQETATTSSPNACNNINNNAGPDTVAVAVAAASSTTSNNNNVLVIREETIEGDPNTAGAPDKGVVMERFLNDPVVVDTAPPPPAPSSIMQDDSHSQIANRSGEDVHRSVSFDMELRTAQYNIANNELPSEEAGRPASDTMGEHNLHLSIDDSNASVQVEVAPEDNILEPESPGGRLSVPSEVAPSSLETDEHHHHHRQHSEMETSLRSVGPSIDRQSTSSNANNADVDGDDSDDEPRVLRLTEAEIQEMAAIEEASIGNAPPSDRDAESLVGDLVGTFGSPNVGESGTNFSQETTTTAMESGSVLSGNQMSAPRSSAVPDDHRQTQNHRDRSMDDMDQNSMDDMAMSASVSSHLVVSPGASVSGASVSANPPSEIIDRGETTTTMLLEVDDEENQPLPPPPSSVVVESTSDIHPLASPPVSIVASDHKDDANIDTDSVEHATQVHSASANMVPQSPIARGESRSSMAIREELKASSGPPAEDIINRRRRPGMLDPAHLQHSSPPCSPQPNAAMRRIASLPDKINSGSTVVDTPQNNRTVDEFDFDKNNLPMTPRSFMSDSIQNLPGDDLWTSPGTKMTVSPIHKEYRTRDPKMEPSLVLPEMQPSGPVEKNTKETPKTQDSFDRIDAGTILSRLEVAFNDVRTMNTSAVEAKESEVYCRGSIQLKAFQKRFLPLALTCLIEVPVMRIVCQSDKLCNILGRKHHQLLLGFIPLIAAVSGNTGAQARTLATTAIVHGHVRAQSYIVWVQTESKVGALLGLGTGAIVGMLAWMVTSGGLKENLVFAVAVAIAQFISSASAGFTGSIFPVLMRLLLGQKAGEMGGLLDRALQDVISTFLTGLITYCVLFLLVSPLNSNEGCIA